MPRTPTAAKTLPKPKPRKKPRFETLGELLQALGGISPDRVRFDPPPGTATEKDLIPLLEVEKRLHELVDGTLVEKAMSLDAAFVAIELARVIGNFVEANGDYGIVVGADGAVKLEKGLVRLPDLLFVRLDRLPGGKVPRTAFLNIPPDLAVEVLSPSNTPAEIALKLTEYFRAGVRLAWVVDPDARTVRVHTAPDAATDLSNADTLTGGDVLPGFAVPVAKLFAKLPPAKPKKPKRGKKSG